MEVEQTNFVTHLTIAVIKIWSNKFEMVMINIIVSCVQGYRNI